MVLFFGKPIDPFFTDVFFMGVLYIVFFAAVYAASEADHVWVSRDFFYLCCCVIPSQNKHVVVLM